MADDFVGPLILPNMADDFVGPPISPNTFLIENSQLHNDFCFCIQCRKGRADAIIGPRRTKDYLRLNFIKHLQLGREERSNSVFENTQVQIIHGAVYKETCLSNTTFKYFKCWAKEQPEYLPLINGTKKDQNIFSRHCCEVNDAAYCFENWEKIVSNLVDGRMTAIDAKTFSVHCFREAASLDWCLAYNEKVRRKCKRKGDPAYSTAKIDDIFNHIIDSGILNDIAHDPQLAAGIGEQLQRKLTSYCRRHRAQHPVE
jgi:hypothetical protein